MERLFEAIDTLAGADTETIKGIVNQSMSKICLFCDGAGHTANQCATKKILDKIFHACQCSISWGRVKSSFMTGDIYTRVDDRRRQKITKRTLRLQSQTRKLQGVQMETQALIQRHTQARSYN